MGWRKRFKLPKAVRKFQPGKALKKLAPTIAGFIPGVGGIASQLMSAREAIAPAPEPVEEYARQPEPEPEPEYLSPAEEFRMAFTRMYGYSPWEGDPKPKPAPRRKAAASGPANKAARKQDVRVARATRAASPNNTPKGRGPATRGRQKSKGPDFGKMAGGAIQWGAQNAGALFDAAKNFRNPAMAAKNFDPAVFAAAAGGFKAPKGFGGGGGGGRARMNVTNVKALKRSIRRLDGFKKLVKKVDRLLPTGARMTGTHGGSSRRAGHKPGCKCVGCR